MFCFQCQETAKGTGCTVRGVCGKEEVTANIQDLIIHHCKGIAVLAKHGNALGVDCVEDAGRAITHALFTTITNANFDVTALIELIKHIQTCKDELRSSIGIKLPGNLPDAAVYSDTDESSYQEKAKTVGILATDRQDSRPAGTVRGAGAAAVPVPADWQPAAVGDSP
jgi:hydroxylamine reductase